MAPVVSIQKKSYWKEFNCCRASIANVVVCLRGPSRSDAFVRAVRERDCCERKGSFEIHEFMKSLDTIPRSNCGKHYTNNQIFGPKKRHKRTQ